MEGEVDEAAPRPGFLRRLLGGKRWIGLLALIALVIGAVVFYNDLSAQPQERTNEYAAAAAPATADVDAAMNRTYLSFDAFLRANFIPKDTFDDVKDINDFEKKVLPIIKDNEKALNDGKKRIKKAVQVIKKNRPVIATPPDTVPIVDNAPVDDAEVVATEGNDLLDGYRTYLASYGDYIAYEARALKLERRLVAAFVDNQISETASLEEIKAGLSSLRGELKKIRKGYKKLKPHFDAKRLHDDDKQLLAIYVGYVGALEDGVNALDVAALDRADADFLSDTDDLRDESGDEFRRFARSSRLQKGSRELTKRANQLEAAIGGLSTADDLPVAKEWQRTPLPAAPKPDSGGDSDKRLTSYSG